MSSQCFQDLIWAKIKYYFLLGVKGSWFMSCILFFFSEMGPQFHSPYFSIAAFDDV